MISLPVLVSNSRCLLPKWIASCSNMLVRCTNYTFTKRATHVHVSNCCESGWSFTSQRSCECPHLQVWVLPSDPWMSPLPGYGSTPVDTQTEINIVHKNNIDTHNCMHTRVHTHRNSHIQMDAHKHRYKHTQACAHTHPPDHNLAPAQSLQWQLGCWRRRWPLTQTWGWGCSWWLASPPSVDHTLQYSMGQPWGNEVHSDIH